MKKDELLADLKQIGLKDGMNLLVHSSLKRIGANEMNGGAETVIDCLLEIIGADGTLLMPAISGCVTKEQPVFHVAKTPSSVGSLTNVFRGMPGVKRSLHPVHSACAVGPKADFFLRDHFNANTPWSPETPYGKLMRNDGWILFLGTDFKCNTCFHALEIEALIPGLHTEEASILFVIDYQGVLHEKKHHWHAPKRNYYVDMELILRDKGVLFHGKTGRGISRLVNAVAMREIILPILKTTPEMMIRPLSPVNKFVWHL